MKKSLTGISAVFLILLISGFFYFMNDPSEKKAGSQTKTSPGLQSNKIDELTSEEVVIPYLKKNRRLPDYYITKKKAREQGWVASKGNLCNVLPGRAIGGDRFSNRGGRLPESSGRKWYEADLNYTCGRRNADRLVYSSDGLCYVTYDHYKTFEIK